MLRTLFYLLLLFALNACSSDSPSTTIKSSSDKQINTKAGLSDSGSFNKAFKEFFTALQKSDTVALNKFIQPQYGLWVIEQPGALPKMTRFKDIRQFKRAYKDKSFFTIAKNVKQCILQNEAFPAFDCADYTGQNSGYAKDGCFVWQPDNFKTSGYWEYADLQQEQIQQIKNALLQLDKSVLHTASSYEFHFAQLDGEWYLLFAKLISPCSA